MAGRNSGKLAGLVVLLAALLALALSNPGMADFKKHMGAAGSSAGQRDVGGLLGKPLGQIAGSVGALAYERKNLLFLSAFVADQRLKMKTYIGFCKVVFIGF